MPIARKELVSLVDQILPMDAGVALGDHHPQAQVARRDGGVLAGGTLAVVGAADERAPGS